MHDDANARKLEQLAAMTDRLLRTSTRPAAVESTHDRFGVPSLARQGRQARIVSPPLPAGRPRAASPSPSQPRPARRAPAKPAKPGATVHGYAPAPRGPESVARGSAPQLPARGAFPPVVRPSMPTTHARQPALVWQPAPVAPPAPLPFPSSPPDSFESERTVCVRPLPSPVSIALTTRLARALRSPSFAAKVIVPALIGAVLGLVAML